MAGISKSPADSKVYYSKKPGSAPVSKGDSTPVSMKVTNAVKAKGSAPKSNGGGVDLAKKHSTRARGR